MSATIQLGDFSIFRMGLGTNRITNSPEAHELVRFAHELGVNFFDTANIYQDGESERGIATALKPFSTRLCIATKGGFKKEAQGVWVPEGHPRKLRQNAEASLLRLGVNQIDLYQLHRVDPHVPIEDSLGALRDLQIEGKVRHIGLSEVPIAQIEKAQSIVRLVSVQNRYNVFERDHDAVLDYCRDNNIVFIAFFPLGSSRHLFPEHIIKVLTAIANQYNKTAHQVALAWLLHRSPFLVPIPGTLSKQHLLENFEAMLVKLSPEDLKRIDGCISP